nr:PAS domain-containing protein [Metabacillus sp. cB07]
MKQETESEYQVLPQAELFAVMNDSGRFQFVSANSEEHLGFKSSEMIGTVLKEYVHKDDLFLVESYFYNEHHLHPCTFRFMLKNETYIWLEADIDFIRAAAAEENQIILKLKIPKTSRHGDPSRRVQLNNPFLSEESQEISIHATELLKKTAMSPVYIPEGPALLCQSGPY